MTAPVAPDSTRPLLEMRDLRIGFPSMSGVAMASNGVSLSVAAGEVLGIVGESGSGKSVTCRAILGMVPHPGSVLGGTIDFDGQNLLELPASKMRDVRAHHIAMVFQDPVSSLNPVFSVGHQVSEVLRVNGGMGRRDAWRRGIELLDRVGIPAPDRRMKVFPHQMSGGMRQRVMIAMALAGEPQLLLADEPTTALDVTIQDQVLRLLADLRIERGMSMILVSHDMGVIGRAADRVAVMYAGRIVEVGPVDTIFRRAEHPYTKALIAAMPKLGTARYERLPTIAGQPPDLHHLDPGCPFASRCDHAVDACRSVSMELVSVRPGHATACPIVRAEIEAP